MGADRWDFYEIAFSLKTGGMDDALALLERFEQVPDVAGAVLSGGNYSPHPFAKASVEKAARVLAELWPNDFDPAERGTFNCHALEVVNAVLTAATNPSASGLSPRARRNRACQCATDPESAPCPACEARAQDREERPADGPELAPGEPWDIGALAELEHGPGSRGW